MRNITFINAGAGSGKTYRLTGILSENIKNRNCRADQVILTTFTRDAAAEFRSRAMEALLKEGMAEQANLLSSAAIGTVHSVAEQFIKKYWHYLGTGVHPDVMSEDDVSFFLKQAIVNIPTREELERLNEITKDLGFTNEYFQLDEDRWQKDLLKILEYSRNYRITDLRESEESSRELLNTLYPETKLNITITEIKEFLENLLNIFYGDKESQAKNDRIKLTEELLENSSLKIPFLHRLISFISKLGVGHRKKVPAVDQIENKFTNFYRCDLIVAQMRDYQQILFRIASKSLQKYIDYKNTNHLIDYGDMEAKLLELLEIKEVAEEIKQQYKQVYVDEFQDSSPIQTEIFINFSEIVEHSYWVGDPKQSIYGFRGTDPELIAAILKEFKVEDERNLTTENLGHSWRSRPEIVEFTNNLFTRALASQVSDAGTISLMPVRPSGIFPDDETHYPIQHWNLNYAERSNKERNNACLAQSIKSFLDKKIQVRDKLKSSYDAADPTKNKEVLRELAPSDITVLRLKNDPVSELAGFIKEQGIMVSASEAGFLNQPEIHMLIACIHYLLDNDDQRAKAILLFLTGKYETIGKLIESRINHMYNPTAPSRPTLNREEIGAPEEINAVGDWYNHLNSWEADEEIFNKIKSFKNQAVLYDIPALIEKIIFEFKLIDIVKQWPNPEQKISNLNTVIKLARSYEERCSLMKLGISLIGFLQYLRETEPGQSASSGNSAVNIMTYFKAKGLEWPVVILTDLEEDHIDMKKMIRRDFHGIRVELNKPLDIENPLLGRQIIVLPWPLGRSKVPDELNCAISGTKEYGKISNEKMKEIKRLLYVGMTRAEDLLITTSYNKGDLRWPTNLLGSSAHEDIITRCPEGVSKEDLFNTGKEVQIAKKQLAPDTEKPRQSDNTNLLYKKGGPVQETRPHFASPSAEIFVGELNVSILTDFNFRITQHMQDAEEELGDCLHNVFYRYRPGVDDKDFTGIAGKIIMNHGLAASIPEPTQVMQSIKNLYEFLEKEYGPAEKTYRELPLQQEIDGVVYRGEADLVWETENDLILVDYKSYPGKKSDITNPTHAKYTGRYAGQLLRYQDMLNKSHPAGKQVKKMLVYYAVIGCVVKSTREIP